LPGGVISWENRIMTDRRVEITEFIRQEAFAQGFDLVGFVPARELEAEGKRLRSWLERGYHGEMSWMSRDVERRVSPQLLFPEARSVIVVALNYYTPNEHSEDPERGKVSRYAWGDDYHYVIGRKLRALLEKIKQRWPAAEGKICVDAQPTMDKAWAVRAGLGWIGKNSNVITREFGSWIFIGEILFNLDLEYTEKQVEDHCGSCNLCIEACPTQALEPYVVNSQKCISYATIELRSESLPQFFTGKMDGWIYGCDICQDVCPWNRFEKPTSETAFEPREGVASPLIEEILTMDHGTYVERFRKSPVKRAKLTGLKRNAGLARK
jgi:epoxyqueuosine reductase